MPIRVNIDGTIFGHEGAKISVFDHGFLFGDSVYETLRTYRGRPFLFSRHFRRLEHSASATGIRIPWDRQRTRDELQRTLEAAGNPGESRIRLVVTRGVGDLTPDPEACPRSSVILMVLPLPELPAPFYHDGVGVVISSLYRDRQLAGVKTGNLINQVLAFGEAVSKNAFESILLTSGGFLSDGTSSNVYLAQGRKLLTPSREAGILEGITRGIVLELAREAGISVVEGLFSIEEIGRSEEMFLTSTTREIIPVTQVDGRPVGTGRPGPITKQLGEAYRQSTERLLQED